MRIGRHAQCSFNTPTGEPPVSSSGPAQNEQQACFTSSEEVRHLKAEVAYLKDLLSCSQLPRENDIGVASVSEAVISVRQVLNDHTHDQERGVPLGKSTGPPKHPKNRAQRGYYTQHSLF